MKKKTTEVEKVEVEITEGKEQRIVGHFTDRHYATGTSIDFTTYRFRIKVAGDDEEDDSHESEPNSYSCVIYMDPEIANELLEKLKSAMNGYEKQYGNQVILNFVK